MQRILIRPYTLEDAEELLSLQLANKEHILRWSPVMGTNEFYTLEGQQKRINESKTDHNEDKRYVFGIFLTEEDSETLIGDIQFNFVVRGPRQTSMIGYYIGQQYNGKGYMTEALKLALRFGFENLKLHRITAGVNPENSASLRVLEKVGFRREGYERKSLLVHNEWTDVVLFAMLAEDYYNNKHDQDQRN
ncbi:GNAT family N-acetyltransferase [Bacillus suaedaesalsae]|uniref:GNAT family N-acetyltransferase n=1 Tax=Bacillus suaedaesalsae TaxID=2810349 RepID=A0ABS2DDT4_9BACI|nr:GNAT family protein [Bacillus suaedaesalsae]MBM6616608.1 GNAT family N-acetyltransferase [Bacillus suaedaesalsae]